MLLHTCPLSRIVVICLFFAFLLLSSLLLSLGQNHNSQQRLLRLTRITHLILTRIRSTDQGKIQLPPPSQRLPPATLPIVAGGCHSSEQFWYRISSRLLCRLPNGNNCCYIPSELYTDRSVPYISTSAIARAGSLSLFLYRPSPSPPPSLSSS